MRTRFFFTYVLVILATLWGYLVMAQESTLPKQPTTTYSDKITKDKSLFLKWRIGKEGGDLFYLHGVRKGYRGKRVELYFTKFDTRINEVLFVKMEDKYEKHDLTLYKTVLIDDSIVGFFTYYDKKKNLSHIVGREYSTNDLSPTGNFCDLGSVKSTNKKRAGSKWNVLYNKQAKRLVVIGNNTSRKSNSNGLLVIRQFSEQLKFERESRLPSNALPPSVALKLYNLNSDGKLFIYLIEKTKSPAIEVSVAGAKVGKTFSGGAKKNYILEMLPNYPDSFRLFTLAGQDVVHESSKIKFADKIGVIKTGVYRYADSKHLEGIYVSVYDMKTFELKQQQLVSFQQYSNGFGLNNLRSIGNQIGNLLADKTKYLTVNKILVKKDGSFYVYASFRHKDYYIDESGSGRIYRWIYYDMNPVVLQFSDIGELNWIKSIPSYRAFEPAGRRGEMGYAFLKDNAFYLQVEDDLKNINRLDGPPEKARKFKRAVSRLIIFSASGKISDFNLQPGKEGAKIYRFPFGSFFDEESNSLYGFETDFKKDIRFYNVRLE